MTSNLSGKYCQTRKRDQISREQRIIHPGAGTKILFLDTLA